MEAANGLSLFRGALRVSITADTGSARLELNAFSTSDWTSGLPTVDVSHPILSLVG